MRPYLPSAVAAASDRCRPATPAITRASDTALPQVSGAPKMTMANTATSAVPTAAQMA